jgi:hypothetical protein
MSRERTSVNLLPSHTVLEPMAFVYKGVSCASNAFFISKYVSVLSFANFGYEMLLICHWKSDAEPSDVKMKVGVVPAAAEYTLSAASYVWDRRVPYKASRDPVLIWNVVSELVLLVDPKKLA